jgi:hypothetical protein
MRIETVCPAIYRVNENFDILIFTFLKIFGDGLMRYNKGASLVLTRKKIITVNNGMEKKKKSVASTHSR